MRRNEECRCMRPPGKPLPAQCVPVFFCRNSGAPHEAVAKGTEPSPMELSMVASDEVSPRAAVSSACLCNSTCSLWNLPRSVVFRWQLFISMYLGKLTKPPTLPRGFSSSTDSLILPDIVASCMSLLTSPRSVTAASLSQRRSSADRGWQAMTFSPECWSWGEDLDFPRCWWLPSQNAPFFAMVDCSCPAGLFGSASGGFQGEFAFAKGGGGDRTKPLVMGCLPNL
mmetsp:Transcript_45774/g.74390  ORF Transcript_45774/g.74390 Transcript_45774/m.74390 type:complete len:226 (+) Transcript_45774:75-752(+)